jgi:hypothetical protein
MQAFRLKYLHQATTQKSVVRWAPITAVTRRVKWDVLFLGATVGWESCVGATPEWKEVILRRGLIFPWQNHFSDDESFERIDRKRLNHRESSAGTRMECIVQARRWINHPQIRESSNAGSSLSQQPTHFDMTLLDGSPQRCTCVR